MDRPVLMHGVDAAGVRVGDRHQPHLGQAASRARAMAAKGCVSRCAKWARPGWRST